MMAAKHQQDVVHDDYEKRFDAREYLELFYDPLHLETQNGVVVCLLNNIYSILNTDIIQEKSHGSVLDFGCGPSILGALCASKKCSNVVCADLVDGCRNEILKWLRNDRDSFDWSSYIKYLSDKEGIDSNQLEKRTRSSIRYVIPCDARAEKPLGDCPPLAPYNIIMANLVMQTACPTKETFISAIKNLCSYLKHDGLFIMAGILNDAYYSFGDPPKTFESLRHNEQDVREFMKEAGMTIVSLITYKGNSHAEDADRPGAMDGILYQYIVTSRKGGE